MTPELVTAWVAVLALVATVVTIFIQRVHNRKSVVPVAQFVLGDYENCLEVSLANKGIGPLRITRFTYFDGSKKFENIYEQMPPLPDDCTWFTYTGYIVDRCLSPGETLGLLILRGNPEDAEFAGFRDQVREALSKGFVTIQYKDVYGKQLPEVSRSLFWFERHLPKEHIAS